MQDVRPDIYQPDFETAECGRIEINFCACNGCRCFSKSRGDQLYLAVKRCYITRRKYAFDVCPHRRIYDNRILIKIQSNLFHHVFAVNIRIKIF
ncbi:hypothetical protein BCO26_1677 [Heyndrickxia coagulans 2-6]|nr:hypothetical protein BCO26_1677 [Heyndrickxia coagulans 2-6]